MNDSDPITNRLESLQERIEAIIAQMDRVQDVVATINEANESIRAKADYATRVTEVAEGTKKITHEAMAAVKEAATAVSEMNAHLNKAEENAATGREATMREIADLTKELKKIYRILLGLIAFGVVTLTLVIVGNFLI